MKRNMIKVGLVIALVAVTGTSFGQKIAITDAAVEFQNRFKPALMQGKMDEARASLLNAKASIDKAAAHPDTAKDPKMLFYKGEIYGASLSMVRSEADTSYVFDNFGKDALDVAVEAYRESYKSSKKFQADIEQSLNMSLMVLENLANTSFKDEKYKEAGDAFAMMYKLTQAKNIDEPSYLNNAAVSYSNAKMYAETAEIYAELAKIGDATKAGEYYALAGDAYGRANNYDKALEILKEGKAKLGNNKEVLLEIVRVNLAQGNNAEAEKSLNDAIAADPSNKQLHYVIGTIYTDLKDYEKAEAAFGKALELDANYKDAMYNMGAMLVTWGQDLNKEASNMKLSDWRYDLTIEKAEKAFQRALVPLEKFIAMEPKNASVLMVLFQIHQNLGNTDKAMEFKKRFEETQK